MHRTTPLSILFGWPYLAETEVFLVVGMIATPYRAR
nr:MAG TPA: exoribonuclease [Herelleviridae sp.]